jgi:tetratricopeptide (TPR) repeat protein
MRFLLPALWLLAALAGCAGVPGWVLPVLPAYEPFVTLPRPLALAEGETYDCGAEALHAVMAYHGRIEPFEAVRAELLLPGVQGTFPPTLAAAARRRGVRARPVEGSFEALRAAVDAGRPAVAMLHIRGRIRHYLVAIGYHPEREWAVFEFYGGRKWLFTRSQLERAWEPCGRLMLEFEPDPVGAALERARALEADGRLEEALALYRGVDPPTPESRLGAGNCLALSGDLAGARVEYEAAHAAGLRDPELLNNLADVRLALGGGGALALAEEAAAGYRASLATETTEIGRAIAARRLALSLGTLGSARLASGDARGARACFEESLALVGEKGDPELRARRLAQIEECRGR